MLLDQAAGIVIDLLVALSVIALVTAGVMLAASARAEVQRRLGAIGVRRAVGASRGHVALAQGLEALLVAVPAATVGRGGRGAGDLRAGEPAADAAERAAARRGRWSLPLVAGWLASVAIPVVGDGVAGVAGGGRLDRRLLLRRRRRAAGRRAVEARVRGVRRAAGWPRSARGSSARGGCGSRRPWSRSGSRPRSCC